MICTSEKYFDSSILVDDKRIQSDSYSLIRVDHSNNTKRSGVYYEESLSI